MVKRKGGGKKQVLHLSEFLGDAAPATPLTVPEYHNECSTDLSLPGQWNVRTLRSFPVYNKGYYV